jgi:aminopeptidase N
VALNEIHFRLFPNILGGEVQVTNLQADGAAITPQYNLENSLMILPLSKALQPGESVVIKMDFSLRVAQDLEASYGMQAYYQDVLALAHAYPMICVYDDEGWNEELPVQYGDITYADASFYLVRVSAPKDLMLVSSGQWISADEAGQVQTKVAASGPARDFFLVASPHYQEMTQTLGGVTIRSYASPDSADAAQLVLDTAADALGVYDKRYAPYPYSELDFVSTPNLALGIEYPGAIALTTRAFDIGAAQRGSAEAAVLEATVAHEVGHQFFYNLVGNDQLDDPWLDEALAQFLPLQYYKDVYGENAGQGFQASLRARWEKLGFEPIPIGLPVAAYQPEQYGPIIYGRGPLFVEALQEQMGTPAFDAFLKEYTESLSWDIATPAAFQSLAEKHCECDLDALFNEWVYP